MEYITKAQHRADKARLTKAQRSGDLDRILDAVEKTVDGWEGKAWPDDWHRWFVALEDVVYSRTATAEQLERAMELSRRS
jgi:hypothetical protein